MYSLTGIFYNKEQAAQIGMTEPPETLAEFDTVSEIAGMATLSRRAPVGRNSPVSVPRSGDDRRGRSA